MAEFSDHRRKYPTVCSIEGCSAPHSARGYCNNHWYRWRHGLDLGQALRVKRTAADLCYRDEWDQKQCVTCLEWLPETAFNKYRKSPDGRYSHCAACIQKRGRWYRLKSQYAMTPKMFHKLLAQQRGVCAICKIAIDADTCHVDHDHSCCEDHRKTCGGCVRGLLCPACNTGIGSFKDSTDRLRAAIAYLESRQVKLPLAI